MKKQFVITFTASLAAGAVGLCSAHAKADAGVTNWSGINAGINSGYASGTNHAHSLNGISNSTFNGGEGGNTSGSFSPQTDHISGGFGGAQIGCNLQSANIVYGVEADLQKSNITGNFTTNLYPGSANTTTSTMGQKIDWFSTLRGEAGYSLGNVLLYGTGGLALAGVKADITNVYSASGGNNLASMSDNKTQVGWAAGGGAKLAVYGNWVIDAQYLHISLNKENFHFNDSTNAINLVNQNRSDFDVFKIGISYKF